MKNNTKNKLLIIILLLAGFLRLWKLGSVPPHLTPDEASLGYNAYSILKTGKDEYGAVLPIIFKSFGDYKPGLYVYASIIPVAIFGLTEFAVRLPSTLAGIAAVYLVYLIVKEFLENKWLIVDSQLSKKAAKNKLENGKCLPAKVLAQAGKMEILVPALLAVSPWHLHFSRGAWEVNFSLTLTLTGIYFFLSSFKKQKNLIFSAAFFALTLLTYQGAKLSTLIVVVILAAVFNKELFKFNKKILSTSLLIGLVISIPIIISMFGKTGRLQVFSIFSATRSEDYIQTILDQGDEKVGSLSYYLYHSEPLFFLRMIMSRWFNHYSTRFLFFEGDWQNERHSAPNVGQFLIADIVLLGLGLFFLIGSKGKFKPFIFLWLVLSSLPAILSRDQVHAVRALNMLVPLVFIAAVGLVNLFELFKRNKLQKISLGIFALIYLGNFIYYLDAYYIHLPIHDAKYWYYGYREAVEEVRPFRNSNRKIVFQQSFSQPYIYFLFYEKYDPAKYQRQASLEPIGSDVGLVYSLDNIEFLDLSWPFPNMNEGTIVVADNVAAPNELIGESFRVLKNIKYPDDVTTAFRVMEVK